MSARPVSFWLRDDLVDEIDAAAAEVGVTRSAWVKAAIRRSLSSPPPASLPSSTPD